MHTLRKLIVPATMVVVLLFSAISSAQSQKKAKRTATKKSAHSADAKELIYGRNVDRWPKFEHTVNGAPSRDDLAIIYRFLWTFWKNGQYAVIKLHYYSTDTGGVFYIFVEQLNGRWVVSTTSEHHQQSLPVEITHYPSAYFLERVPLTRKSDDDVQLFNKCDYSLEFRDKNNQTIKLPFQE